MWKRCISALQKGHKIPDSVSQISEGKVVAIEVERTVKTVKRYREIVGIYLSFLEESGWNEVWYILILLIIFERLESVKITFPIIFYYN